jgi:hypothetical protein
VQPGIGTFRDRGAKEISRRAIHVQNDSKILIVERLDVLRHEGVGVESD